MHAQYDNARTYTCVHTRAHIHAHIHAHIYARVHTRGFSVKFKRLCQHDDMLKSEIDILLDITKKMTENKAKYLCTLIGVFQDLSNIYSIGIEM